jgi:uncharacterized protein with LGFP repeats
MDTTTTARRRSRLLLPTALLAVATTAAAAVFLVVPAGERDADGPGTAELVRTGRVDLRRVEGSPVAAAEVAVAGGQTRMRTERYSMVAVTWRGPAPQVQVSTRAGGAWSRWQDLEPLADGPDDRDSRRIQGSDLLWVESAQDVRTRVQGSATDVRLVLIDPGTTATGQTAARGAVRSTSQAAQRTTQRSTQPTVQRTASARVPTEVPRPRIRSRKRWGADESWRDGRPRYIRSIRQVHVHHTVNSNDYRRADVAAMIRGMYRYHTYNLGWSDIGYNFLVDRFGRAWMGRAGGAARRVRGAHTLGFNHSSTGISVIGNFDQHRPPRAVLRTVSRLAAWKLDIDGRNPRGRIRVRSEGSDKYPAGKVVRLPVIDGHRDTNDTACPGQRLYDRLPTIRRRAARRIERFSGT